MALLLCASAPQGALAQSVASDAASPGTPAAQSAPTAVLGASIRKSPGAAATGSPPAAADSAAAAAAPAASAGAPSSSETTGTTALATPGIVVGSDSAPTAVAPPAGPVRAEARAGRHARSASTSQATSAKADFKDAGSNGDDSGKDKNKDSPFSSLQFAGNKGPVDIKADALDLDYKGNVVTFRGHVHAIQADAVLTSDTLTVTYGKDFHEVKEMVANNNVRMSQGTRWATGDRAVLDQAKHTVTLTGSPVVHDGEDQVAGTKITVHLDTGKSEVEGARAVFFPKDQKTRDNKTRVANSP